MSAICLPYPIRTFPTVEAVEIGDAPVFWPAAKVRFAIRREARFTIAD